MSKWIYRIVFLVGASVFFWVIWIYNPKPIEIELRPLTQEPVPLFDQAEQLDIERVKAPDIYGCLESGIKGILYSCQRIIEQSISKDGQPTYVAEGVNSNDILSPERYKLYEIKALQE